MSCGDKTMDCSSELRRQNQRWGKKTSIFDGEGEREVKMYSRSVHMKFVTPFCCIRILQSLISWSLCILSEKMLNVFNCYNVQIVTSCSFQVKVLYVWDRTARRAFHYVFSLFLHYHSSLLLCVRIHNPSATRDGTLTACCNPCMSNSNPSANMKAMISIP